MLENLFVNIRVAAHCTGTTIEQLCNDTRRVGFVTHRGINRSKQAAIFAEEEAQLREQFMIEQVIAMERFQREQETSKSQSPKMIAAANIMAINNRKEQTAVRLVLAPNPKQDRRVTAIETKLALMRQRIAPSKNAAGIAALQAAVMGF